MQKTSIEWVRNPDGTPGFSWNPITGCLNNCEYCYARKLANTRLKERYCANENLIPPYQGEDGFTHSPSDFAKLMPFYPRLWPDKLIEPLNRKKPAGIFVADMSDLFGIGIPKSWTEHVFDVIKVCPKHRFYLLTKCPQNLAKFSPFPSNVFLGVSVTNQFQFVEAVKYLKEIEAAMKFISFEPLLERINIDL